jgi:hypothetical protein
MGRMRVLLPAACGALAGLARDQAKSFVDRLIQS